MSTRRRSTTYSSINMPGSSVKRSGRGLFAVLLCLLIPPLGLMFLWRKGVFRTRGRILVTALATLEMAVILSMMLPSAAITPTLPVPGSAVRYTPAPESDVRTALSNMDQLLRQQQSPDDGSNASSVTPVDQQQQLIEQQAVLSSIVYAYNGAGSRYYHSVTVCGNQSNLLTLTVEEALNEQLSPCPDCDPPTLTSALGAAISTEE